MAEYQSLEEERDFIFRANDAWNRSSPNGKDLLIGPSAFMAILKIVADGGDGQVRFLTVDEFKDNMYWQTIVWIRHGNERRFKTYASLQQLANHPKWKHLNLRLPNS